MLRNNHGHNSFVVLSHKSITPSDRIGKPLPTAQREERLTKRIRCWPFWALREGEI
jgi:hypothetical protein